MFSLAKSKNTSGGKSIKPPVYNPARSSYRTKPKKTEEAEKIKSHYNNYVNPEEDYREKFSEMRIDDNIMPEDPLPEKYSHEFHGKNDNGRQYYMHPHESARIGQQSRMETEIMGTIATERAESRREQVEEVYQVPPNIHSKHRRKQSANIPYKMSMPHTNIEKLSVGEKADLNYQEINCQFLNTDDMNEEDEE